MDHDPGMTGSELGFPGSGSGDGEAGDPTGLIVLGEESAGRGVGCGLDNFQPNNLTSAG